MTPPFGVSTMAVALMVTLGTVPAVAQRAGGNGPGFHGGGLGGPHPGFVGPGPGFGRGPRPGFVRGFVAPRPGFRHGFAEPRVVVRPSFPAGYVGSRS